MMSMEEIKETASRLGIDLSQLDLDSISLPPGENFGIKSDDEDLNEEDSLEFDAGFGNIIVVDNLPVVQKEKFEKLEGVVRKIYSQIGVIKEDGLWMPLDPATQKTLGYCFIEYNTPQENLQHWLTDEKARDQFVIRAGSDTEVLWNDARHLKPEPVYKRSIEEHYQGLTSFKLMETEKPP